VNQSDREEAVSRAFVTLADTLVDDYDIIDMLDQLVTHSVALLAADAAGIMLGDAHRHLRVVAASSDDAELMELLQLQNEQGPCLDCYHTATPVRCPTSPSPTNGRCSQPQSRRPAAFGPCTRCRYGCAANRSARSTCFTTAPDHCPNPT
jgi:hypothetical protein